MENAQANKRLRFSIEYILSPDIESKVKNDTRVRVETEKVVCSDSTSSDSSLYKVASKSIRGNKRERTIFTKEQLQQLEDRFLNNQYPNPQERHETAVALGLSDKKLKTWFQNRRMKFKKDYWDKVLVRTHQTDQLAFSTTIAVPCTLPCLVSNTAFHPPCRSDMGYSYCPSDVSTRQTCTNEYPSSSRATPSAHQGDQCRLSHFNQSKEEKLMYRAGFVSKRKSKKAKWNNPTTTTTTENNNNRKKIKLTEEPGHFLSRDTNVNSTKRSHGLRKLRPVVIH